MHNKIIVFLNLTIVVELRLNHFKILLLKNFIFHIENQLQIDHSSFSVEETCTSTLKMRKEK